MLRWLLLRPRKSYHSDREEEVLFPDLAKQNSRETLNSRQLFDTLPFARISGEGELLSWVASLQSYSGDRLRFVGRVEVSEGRGEAEEERNEVLLVREPVFSREDVITFLLVLRWFPNAMRTHRPPRKASFAEKELKPRHRTDSAELLQLVFLLVEKLYLPERYVDEFVQVVAQRNPVSARQANCLTVLLPAAAKHRLPSTNLASSQSHTQHQYQEYLYDNAQPPLNRDELDRSSLRSADSHPDTLSLLKRRSARNSERSPRADRSLRQSSARSGEEGRRGLACNLARAKKYFSTVEYLVSEGELGVETVMCHLNDDRNAVNVGWTLGLVKAVVAEWPRLSQFEALLGQERERALEGQLTQSLANYRLVAALELSQLGSISLEAIYAVVRELNAKAMAEFLLATRPFLHDPRYNDAIAHLEAELCSLESELISHYAVGKYEQGRRLLRDLEKRRERRGVSGEGLLLRVVGRQEVGALEMGFKMYRQLLEGRLEDGFRELGQGQLRGRVSLTGNNDEDMLANVEARIEICEQRRRMLEAAITLSEKEGDSLRLMMRSLDGRVPTDLLSAVSDTQE